jgi:hypothetical protein
MTINANNNIARKPGLLSSATSIYLPYQNTLIHRQLHIFGNARTTSVIDTQHAALHLPSSRRSSITLPN